MKAQVSFVTDSTLKKAAIKKAKQNGITLKAFLTYCLKGFLDDDINLNITQKKEPLILRQLSKHEITPELKTEAKKYYNMTEEEFINSQ